MKNSKIFSERIKNLQAELSAEKLEGFLIHHPTDLFYFTGLELSLGWLLILKNKSALFVDGRYLEVAKEKSPVSVRPLKKEEQVKVLEKVKCLGFDGDTLSYEQFLALKKLGKKGKTKLISKPFVLKKLRSIKDPFEIKKMQESASFAYKAYEQIKKKLRPGISEIALTRELEIYCLKQGAEKMSFPPIVAFGKNSALPHHHPGKTKLKENDIVLFDLGVVLEGYCSDMTRVEFVGKIDPELKRIYEINRSAQKAALAKCRPGILLKELDLAARKVMAKAGLEEYFVHGLGHGVGLDIHEYPGIKKEGVHRNVKLEVGMVITIEPGIYLPRKGGVRYEDTIVITPRGYKNFYPES